MKREKVKVTVTFCSIVLAGAVFAPNAWAQCSRETLQMLADTYVKAQTAGDPTMLSFAAGSSYGENDEAMDAGAGVLAEALTVLGITFQQIQKYEKGSNRIGASRLQNIARVLSVPPAFFFEGAPGSAPEGVAGMEESRSANYVVDFLSSSEGIQLNKAFLQIGDPRLRRRLIDLIRAIAGHETEG
jgi:transcriptional regulator with XRE-family HTH domain